MAPVVKLANYQHACCDTKTFKMKIFFYSHLHSGAAQEDSEIFIPDAKNNFVYQNIFSICKLLPSEVHNPNKQLADVI